MIENKSAARNSPDTTHHYARVEWVEPDSIHVLESSHGFPLIQPNHDYRLTDLFEATDSQVLIDRFRNPGTDTSVTEVATHDEHGSRLTLMCTIIPDNGGTVCLWHVKKSAGQEGINILSMAAHDLRSPINSIIGLSNVMQVILHDQNPDLGELGKMVQLIKTTGNNAIDFTSDIMELSEMESAHYRLETEEVSANQFLAHFIDTHRLITLKKNLKVEVETTLQPEDTFMINQSKITRVMGNLLSNATKFSNPEGRIIFRLLKKNKKIILQIEDEGIGMSQKIIDTLFDKFGKSKRLGLEGEKSHGLGMSIVKQIMELHNGEIDISSEEGKGTTVNLIFKSKN